MRSDPLAPGVPALLMMIWEEGVSLMIGSPRQRISYVVTYPLTVHINKWMLKNNALLRSKTETIGTESFECSS